MRSEKPGRRSSAVEVTHVSTHGFWLLLSDEEIFVSFDAFPWFRDATIGQIQSVKLLRSDHLYWAELDVDLSVESIRHPDRYPLVSRLGVDTPARRSAGTGRVSDKPFAKRRRDPR